MIHTGSSYWTVMLRPTAKPLPSLLCGEHVSHHDHHVVSQMLIPKYFHSTAMWARPRRCTGISLSFPSKRSVKCNITDQTDDRRLKYPGFRAKPPTNKEGWQAQGVRLQPCCIFCLFLLPGKIFFFLNMAYILSTDDNSKRLQDFTLTSFIFCCCCCSSGPDETAAHCAKTTAQRVTWVRLQASHSCV